MISGFKSKLYLQCYQSLNEKKMKTTIKQILLVAVMLVTLIGYAKESTEPTNTVDSKKVKVEFYAVKKGQSLTIKSNNGKTIYSRFIEQDGNFSKSFDLSALPNGNYHAELNKDLEIVIKPFTINNGLVTFLVESNKIIRKPVVKVQGELLYIFKNDLDKEVLNITLLHNNAIILKDKIKGLDKLKKVYKLSKDKKGDYQVIINYTNRTFTKDFTI